MSCHEWEKGEWNLSCVEYRKFRDALVKGWNEFQDKTLEQALQVKTELERLMRGNKGAEIDRLFYEACENVKKATSRYDGWGTIAPHMDADVIERAILRDYKEVPDEINTRLSGKP